MTTLGQAYVQIMPSAKGISGSIQKAINPEATAAGKSAGKNLATSIASSMSSLGSTLTKAITVPALGAATAAGGIVAAFGWKRLVGLDSARAQLEGLGYDIESVDRISSLVKDAIQGTVTTMAEGVSVAAGGLAAGVKEGAELERYIKLVGDAAAGSGRPIADMAMIFDRVQGSGKLMTQELNMIQDGMPGFSGALAKHLGVAPEKMREMVTAGEVSSSDFLNVMDSFAGDMSSAYANSWEGMVSNTKAWIGIMGESILGGVFEQSKETIAEFMEYLKSEDVQVWAKEMGATIGEAFENIIEKVKSAIGWWVGLSEGTQSLIMTMAGITVAIGPVLLVVGKLITTVMAISKWFGLLKAAATVVGGAIGALSTPVLIAIGAIAAIIAIGIALWKNWDTVKAKASQLGGWISNVFSSIKNAIVNTWNSVRSTTSSVWNIIRSTISIVVNAIRNVISNGFNAARSIVSNISNSIRSTISSVFNSLRGIVTGAFNGVRSAVSSGMSSALRTVIGFVSKFRDAGRRIVTSIADGIKGAISKVTNAISNVAQTVRDFLPFSPPERGPMMERNEISKFKANKTVQAMQKMSDLNTFKVAGLVL